MKTFLVFMRREHTSMTDDRTVKLLLAAIAVGLWMNMAVNLFRPIEVQAQSDLSIRSIQTHVASMQITLNAIAAGLCLNDKLC